MSSDKYIDTTTYQCYNSHMDIDDFYHILKGTRYRCVVCCVLTDKYGEVEFEEATHVYDDIDDTHEPTDEFEDVVCVACNDEFQIAAESEALRKEAEEWERENKE